MMGCKWGDFWFLNGGMIHSLWKRRNYTEIRRLAECLPKLAWDKQQVEIEKLQAEVAKYKQALEMSPDCLQIHIDSGFGVRTCDYSFHKHQPECEIYRRLRNEALK